MVVFTAKEFHPTFPRNQLHHTRGRLYGWDAHHQHHHPIVIIIITNDQQSTIINNNHIKKPSLPLPTKPDQHMSYYGLLQLSPSISKSRGHCPFNTAFISPIPSFSSADQNLLIPVQFNSSNLELSSPSRSPTWHYHRSASFFFH